MSRYFSLPTAFAVAFLMGCSTSSQDITPKYVSSAQFASYDCDQIEQELIRVSGRANEMTGKLDKNASNDSKAATAGIILFWPALLFLGGTNEQEAEYAQLKGEYNALERASIQKRCGLLEIES